MEKQSNNNRLVFWWKNFITILSIGILWLFIFLIVFIAEGQACNVSVFEAIPKLRTLPYEIMVFYKPGEKRSEKMLKKVEALKGKDIENVNVEFKKYDYNKLIKEKDQGGEDILKFYKVKKIPLLVITSPLGRPVLRFKNKIIVKEFKMIFDSPARKKIRESLKKTPAIFVCVAGKKAKDRKKLFKNIEKCSDLCKEFFKVDMSIVEIDPGNIEERYLLNILGLKKNLKKATAFIIIGKGRRILMPITAETKTEEIVETLQILASPCSCNTPQIFKGEDILMERKQRDEQKWGEHE
jgi:hypothetical protein